MSWPKLEIAKNKTNKRVIPAYILVGFLGSGKTSILSHLIDWCLVKGLRPGVVLNEFGATWVDGALINTNGLSLTELGDGCLCCTASDDLLPTMLQIAAKPDIDLILLESSGFANPAEMLEELSSPFLWESLEVGGVISVVDCTRFENLVESGNSLVRQQAEFADILVMNKCDLISEDHRLNLRKQLENIAPHSLIFEAEKGFPYRGVEVLLSKSLEIGRKHHQLQEHLKFNPLIDLSNRRVEGLQEKHYHADKEFFPSGFQSSIQVLTFEIERPVDKEAFELFLNSLPENVYRAKGFIRIAGEPGPYVFQYLANFAQVVPLPKRVPPNLSGVFIGHNLNAELIEMKLLECQDKATLLEA